LFRYADKLPNDLRWLPQPLHGTFKQRRLSVIVKLIHGHMSVFEQIQSHALCTLGYRKLFFVFSLPFLFKVRRCFSHVLS